MILNLPVTDTNYILISLIFIWKMYEKKKKIRYLSSSEAEKIVGIS
jgi:hypothetical protein